MLLATAAVGIGTAPTCHRRRHQAAVPAALQQLASALVAALLLASAPSPGHASEAPHVRAYCGAVKKQQLAAGVGVAGRRSLAQQLGLQGSSLVCPDATPNPYRQAINCNSPYSWLLPEVNWDLGIAFQGNPARARAAMHRLIVEGKNLTVGFIGGCLGAWWSRVAPAGQAGKWASPPALFEHADLRTALFLAWVWWQQPRRPGEPGGWRA